MESKPAFPASAAHSAKGSRLSKLQITGLISAILLLILVVVIVATSLSGNEVVWLTPAQLAARTQPGPFSGFKQKVRNLAAPVWKRLHRAQPLISLDCKVLTLPSTAPERAGLGPTVTTSADGMRAWILAAPEAAAFQQFLKTNAGENLLGNSAIQTMHGGQVRIIVRPAPHATPESITVDVLPRNSSGSIRLILNATATAKVDSPVNAALIRTNLAVTCEALIPNGGSLVLDGGSPKNGGEKRYWLIVSPRVWISEAKPIK